MVDRSPKDVDEQSTPDERQFSFTQTRTPSQRTGIDDRLELLANRRRRDVLYYLSDNEVASVDALATAIAARENDIPTDMVSAGLREPVLLDLYHNQLPKLTDSRLVEYDPRSGAIKWSGPASDLETLLECCHGLESRPSGGGENESDAEPK